jgi:hypothetical protein
MAYNSVEAGAAGLISDEIFSRMTILGMIKAIGIVHGDHTVKEAKDISGKSPGAVKLDQIFRQKIP